jgi:cell wall-associated NlpC family hydrolase/prophage tail gpP-like protein
MRHVKAVITVDLGQKGRREFPVQRVSNYVVESALDTDADLFSTDIPDPTNYYDFLKDRDVEMVVNLFTDSKNGQLVERLHSGVSDDFQYDSDDRVLSITGRDYSCLATDTDAPPGEWKHQFLGDFIRPRALRLGFPKVLCPATSSFTRIYTDGSESEWQLWYRLAREKDFWIWTQPDGLLVISPLNYGLKPMYLFGVPAEKFRGTWHRVEQVKFHRNTQQRVHDVWMYGERGDIPMKAEATDHSIDGWLRKNLKIQLSTQAKTQGELDKNAQDELYDSVVGAVEFTLTIPDHGQRIRQNQMAFVNLPEHGLSDLYFIVGTRLIGAEEEGYTQEIRFRERGYALPRRVPDAPEPPKKDDKKDEGETVTPESAAKILAQCGVRWGADFIRAAKAWHKGSKGSYGWDWDLTNFLGVLLSICQFETRFQNIRVYEAPNSGDKVEGPEWYPKPDPGHAASTKLIDDWYHAFANRKGNTYNPNPAKDAGVGPMQLVKPLWKQWADSDAGTSSTEGSSLLVTVNDIMAAIEGTPMEDNAQDFYDAGVKYSVQPGFMVGLAKQESELGLHNFHPFNPFGYHQDTFASYAEAIDVVTSAIAGKPPSNNPNYMAAGRFAAVDIYTGGGHKAYCQSGCHTDALLSYCRKLKVNLDDVRIKDEPAETTSTGQGEYQGGRWKPRSNIYAAARALAEDAGFGLDSSKPAQIWIAVQEYVDGKDAASDAAVVKRWFDSRYQSCAAAALQGGESISQQPTGQPFTLHGIHFPAMRKEIEEAVRRAMSQLGVDYHYGGGDCSGPTVGQPHSGSKGNVGFDCSGLTLFAWCPSVKLDHYSGSGGQFDAGTAVGRDELKPGDLVFFATDQTPSNPGHVGMYLNENQFIQAPHTGDVVKVSSMGDDYYRSEYCGARRLLAWAESPVGPPAAGVKRVVIQAGHDVGSHGDQPYGHAGQSGAEGEMSFNKSVRDAVIARLQSDSRFQPVSATAWDASAGATSGTSDDVNLSGDMFISIHYDPTGSGFFFGWPRDRGTARESAGSNLTDKLSTAYAVVAGNPHSRNTGLDQSNERLWGYYAYGSPDRDPPDDVDHIPTIEAACIFECGNHTVWLNGHTAQVAKAIYDGICSYYGVRPLG